MLRNSTHLHGRIIELQGGKLEKNRITGKNILSEAQIVSFLL
jgi:hypothetical protein